MRKLLALILIVLWSGCAVAFPPPLPSSGGSGAMATDAIWDAAGDLAVGTGAITGGRLAIGGAYYLLHSNGTTPAWTLTLGATGTRLTKGWFTDLEVTNAIAGSITGNAATATALAANPADCVAGQFATTIAANGDLTCAAETGDVSGTGDCTGGACYDGSSDGGTYVRLYDGNSHYTELKAGDSSANLTFAFPTAYPGVNNAPIVSSTAGVLAGVGYSIPTSAEVAAGNGKIVKSDGTNLVLSDTLGLSTFILPTGTDDPATTSGMILHDTNDTTFSNAGGTVKWLDSDGTKRVRVLIDSGATNYTPIVKTEFLPIAWAVDGATAPSAIADVTGKEIKARSFSEADDVVFWWIVPPDYVGGIKYRVFYALSANASADDTAVFSMAGSIVANSGDLDGSAGMALTISDELTTDDDQYQVMVTDYSAASNSDWSLAAGGLARLNFSHAAASDMAGAGEPLVIGIEIKYKAKLLLADQY